MNDDDISKRLKTIQGQVLKMQRSHNKVLKMLRRKVAKLDNIIQILEKELGSDDWWKEGGEPPWND